MPNTRKRKTPSTPSAISQSNYNEALEQKHAAILDTFQQSLKPGLFLKFLPVDRDATNVITDNLQMKDLMGLSIACRTTKGLFDKPLIKLKTQELLQSVVYGEYEKVKKIISANPNLLLEKGTVTDYSGRTHSNKTALQLALGAQDTNVVREDKSIAQEGMVELITEHLTKHLKSIGKTQEEIERELETQFRNQLPEGWETKEAKKFEVDKAALDTMITAIQRADQDHVAAVNKLEDKIFKLTREAKPTEEAKSSKASKELKVITESIRKAKTDEAFDNEFAKITNYIFEHNIDNPEDKFIEDREFDFSLLKSIYKFRNHFEPKEPLRTGKHFNLELLVYAAQQYDAKYEAFGNDWDSAKNRMHWQKVFGYIERSVPACDAQIFAQSIWNIIGNGKKLKRTLKFSYNGDANFYPVGSNPNWEIGYNCCGLGGGRVAAGGDRRRGRLVWVGVGAGAHLEVAGAQVAFKTYAKQKQLYGCYAALPATRSEEPLHNTLAH